jgi:hypothetical protein
VNYLIFRVSNGEKSLPHFVIALIVLLTIPDSIGEEWVRAVTYKEDKIESFVDTDSITDDGNLRYFDMYHQLKGSKSYKDFEIERLYSKSYVNCDARTIGYVEVTYEWVNRMEKIAMNIPGSSEVASSMPVKPNSVDEAILDFVCNYKKDNSN